MKCYIGPATAVLLAATAPAALAQTNVSPPVKAELASPKFGAWGFDTAGMDKSASPGADFNRYANGGWLDRTEIPADRSNFGNFYLLRELSDARVRDIIETTAAKPQASGEEGKIGAFYRSFMDEARIEQLDAAPLKPGLDEIRAARTRSDLARLQGANNGRFGVSLFGYGVYDDAKNPSMNVAYIGHGGIGLPDREFYLDPKFADRKVKYQAYVAQMLGMAGWPNAEAAAKAVVDYETKLAEAQWPIADRRDDSKTYNPMSFAELERAAPGFDWRAYAEGAGVPFEGKLVVAENTAFPKLAAIYAETSEDTLRAWAAFHLVDQSAPYLSKRFVDANYAFQLKEMQGQPEPQPRWKRGVGLVNNSLGHAVGKIYADRYFGPRAKAEMDEMVANLQAAFAARIQKVAWMSPATKAAALEKLSKFRANIGYPPKYRDYSGLEVRADDLYGNVQRSGAFEWAYQRSKLGKPVDKLEWSRTPQTVNAWYRTQRNDISFPAGILMPPFFDPDADPAVNYGAIGAVIGHEITHGFDDQGRKSDGEGMLRDWWTAEDAARFQAQADRLEAQYNAYEPLPGAKVNGKLTMGENIADLAGILMALDAYHASLKGKPAPVIDGYTGDQRVFLGWAQFWRTKYRDAFLRQYVATDEHSPAMYRVSGPVRNVDAWYDAFAVKPGDPLYIAPEDRVRIW